MSQFSLPKSHRLLVRKQFDFVFKHPTKLRSKYVDVFYRNSNLQHPRLGLIITKKNMKRAVDRNRFKRLSRESFRLAQQTIPSMDIIVIVKKESLPVQNSVFFNSLSVQWEKIQSKLPSSVDS